MNTGPTVRSPLIDTDTGPVLTPACKVAVIDVLLALFTDAATPLTATTFCAVTVLNPVPVMVTTVPGPPVSGLIAEIAW